MARTPLPTTSSPPSGPSSDENERYPHFMSARAGALSGGSTAYAPAHHPEVDEAGWSNEYLGIVLFIVSEAVMFGAFFAQYFYNRILAPEWPNPAGLPPGFERVPAFPLPVILTVVLVASGFTAHNAQTAIRRDDRDAFQGWLIVTILLGAGFLAGQAYEYTQLIFHEGFSISSGIYGTVFFSLTGLHGSLLISEPLRRRGLGAVLALRGRRLAGAVRNPRRSLSSRLTLFSSCRSSASDWPTAWATAGSHDAIGWMVRTRPARRTSSSATRRCWWRCCRRYTRWASSCSRCTWCSTCC